MKTLEIKNSAILEILQSIFQYKYLFYFLSFAVYLASISLWSIILFDTSFPRDFGEMWKIIPNFSLPSEFYTAFDYAFISSDDELILCHLGFEVFLELFFGYIPIYFLYKSVSERLCPVSKPALRDFLEILIVVLLYESCTIFYIIQHHYWFIICPFLFVFACDAFYLSLIAFIRRLLIKLGINNPLKGIPVFIVSTIIILNFLRWFHS